VTTTQHGAALIRKLPNGATLNVFRVGGSGWHWHLQAGRRSVLREEQPVLPDESAVALAERLQGASSNPSSKAVRQEMRDRLQAALGQLNERDRELWCFATWSNFRLPTSPVCWKSRQAPCEFATRAH
jgi:hypothetical protein